MATNLHLLLLLPLLLLPLQLLLLLLQLRVRRERRATTSCSVPQRRDCLCVCKGRRDAAPYQTAAKKILQQEAGLIGVAAASAADAEARDLTLKTANSAQPANRCPYREAPAGPAAAAKEPPSA